MESKRIATVLWLFEKVDLGVGHSCTNKVNKIGIKQTVNAKEVETAYISGYNKHLSSVLRTAHCNSQSVYLP